ncbi:MAG: DNA primase small subunit PriS [Haloarculaceae archaeon]
MEERTRAYLRGRFRDHYRRIEVSPPPAAAEREWGHIPWTSGSGTTMVRHQSLLDLGDLSDFLARERPRHVYFSAGRYRDPGANSMDEKGWQGSDLVFDLDADHLPSVDPDRDAYGEMLAACKDALERLLSFLEADFGFEDLTVVFSGGRGYHVHVRDAGVHDLDRGERREIVDYVRGRGLDYDALVQTEQRGTVTGRALQTAGGWGRRTHRRLLALVDELHAADEETALDRLQEFEGIGEKHAETIYGVATDNREALATGNVEVGGPGLRRLVDVVAHETVEAENAPIDEPVTTDINRLIRLPGSLHGGSGLAVRRIDRDALDEFDPLVDAVPATFRNHDIAVDVTDGGAVDLGGDSFTLPEGEQTVPEYVGVFLMARGRAEKGRE